MKPVCEVCGWVYSPEKGHPESGVPAGTPWDRASESFVCPECGAGKSSFVPQ